MVIRMLSGLNWSSLLSPKCEDIISRVESLHEDLQAGFWNAQRWTQGLKNSATGITAGGARAPAGGGSTKTGVVFS